MISHGEFSCSTKKHTLLACSQEAILINATNGKPSIKKITNCSDGDFDPALISFGFLSGRTNIVPSGCLSLDWKI